MLVIQCLSNLLNQLKLLIALTHKKIIVDSTDSSISNKILKKTASLKSYI